MNSSKRWHADTCRRSGIGAQDLLKKCGIKQIVDLPGVGEHYMGSWMFSFALLLLTRLVTDHVRGTASYHASDDADTLDVIMRGDEEDRKRM